eukprot:scaffold75620_cov67-Phaeocystis_antarctica.AAC.1
MRPVPPRTTMRGSTGALGVFGGVIRLRSSQDRQFGSAEVGSSEEHMTTTDARREHRSGRPAGTKPARAAARASMSVASSVCGGRSRRLLAWQAVRVAERRAQGAARRHAAHRGTDIQDAARGSAYMSSLGDYVGDSSQRCLSDVATLADRLEVGHQKIGFMRIDRTPSQA